MKNRLRWAAVCGAAALAVHAPAEEVGAPGAYVTPAVMEAAGVDMTGKALPGAGFDAWLAKPAENLVYLNGEWQDLLSELHRVGDVSVLSGNDVVMHLATGQYDPIRGGGAHALVLNQGIDLRLFPGHWEYGVAILPGGDEVPGLAFFDGSGYPVHRVLLTESSDTGEFEAIVGDFKGEKPEFSPWFEEEEPTETPTAETKAEFLKDWSELTDTHAFSRLLRKHKVSRTDALRLAEGEFTAKLDQGSYEAIFSKLVDAETSVILFALNNGCVQISTGAVREVSKKRGTLQLMEKESLTLIALPKITEAWRVSKPTDHGVMHSLELYGLEGEPVAYIFGSRKGDDDTNIEGWNEILHGMPVVGSDNVKVAGTPAEADAASSEAEATADKACPSAKAASSESEAGTCSKTKAASSESEAGTCSKAKAASSESEAGTCSKAKAASSESEAGACSKAKAASSESEAGTCPKAAAASSEAESKGGCCKSNVAAASSEGEETAAVAAAIEDSGPIDTFNLPRRIKSQLTYTVRRMLEFDKNDDGMLSQDELPGRMAGLVARGSFNGDAFLDEEELTRMAYQQIQKRDEKSEAELAERKKH